MFHSCSKQNGPSQFINIYLLLTISIRKKLFCCEYILACEQAHLRENWGKEKKKERGGGGGGSGREIENEPAGMTFKQHLRPPVKM